MLVYDAPVWRPPSEGPNLIIQATLGCSFNHCAFCSMYKTKDFVVRPLDDVFRDIDEARREWPDARRIFLADGDALVLPTDHLLKILEKLAATFPGLQRVTCYATPINLLRKSADELRELRDARLTLVYLGIESGSPDILRRIRKGATPKSIVRSIHNARDGGIKVSATVVLGLGGRERWKDHMDGSADLVNAAPPTYLSTLQVYLEPIVKDDFMKLYGAPFEFQDDMAILAEQERFISRLAPPTPVIFRSNHASNALALAGNLPRDKDRLLSEIARARSGSGRIRPRFLRGL